MKTLKLKKLIILLCLYRVCLSLSRHLITLEILIVCCDLVDEVSARYDLHDTVCSRLDDLMVSLGEEKHARELDHTIVESGDCFHIKMVGRLIEQQDVCT